MKPTGPVNPKTKEIIRTLKKEGKRQKVKIWSDIASRLEKPRRIRPAVNISKIEKHCKKGEIAFVPGKVMGNGKISTSVKVAALSASKSAITKLEEKKGSYLSIYELLKQNPKGKKVRIIG